MMAPNLKNRNLQMTQAIREKLIGKGLKINF